MDLSILSQELSSGLTKLGWHVVVEDEHLDFKHYICQNSAGPLGVFTRLDVLIMMPELKPADASAICLCFIYYADPLKTSDEFNIGRTMRQNDWQMFRSQCESVINDAHLVIENPSVKVTFRPRYNKVKFSESNREYPSFIVEISYCLNCDKFSSIKRIDHTVAHAYADYDHTRDARLEAICAISGSNFHEAEEVLLEAFTDLDPQIRKAAFIVLIECTDIYLPLIWEALHDDDSDVSSLAYEYYYYRKQKLKEVAITITIRCVDECLDALSSIDESVRYQAIQSLYGVTDPRIIEPLVKIIKNNNESIFCRTDALHVLNYFETAEMLNEFYNFFSIKIIGEHAGYLLTRKSNQLAKDLLIKALNSEDRKIRLSAAGYVGLGRDPRVIPPLCLIIDGDDTELRRYAIESLLNILYWIHDDKKSHCSNVTNEITEAKESQRDVNISAEYREMLLTYLKKLLCDPDDDVRGKALMHLCVFDKNFAVTIVFDELIKYISRVMNDHYNENIYTVFDGYTIDWIRYGLDDVIPRLNEVLFCEPLGQLLKSKWWNVKVWAAKLLFILEDNRGRSQLIEALDCEKLRVRVEAANFLLSHGYKLAWDVLIGALTDKKNFYEDVDYMKPWYCIEEWSINVLIESDKTKAIDFFIAVLNEPESYSVSSNTTCLIVRKLGELGDPRAIDPIKKWQYREFNNYDDYLGELVEKALSKLNLVTS